MLYIYTHTCIYTCTHTCEPSFIYQSEKDEDPLTFTCETSKFERSFMCVHMQNSRANFTQIKSYFHIASAQLNTGVWTDQKANWIRKVRCQQRSPSRPGALGYA